MQLWCRFSNANIMSNSHNVQVLLLRKFIGLVKLFMCIENQFIVNKKDAQLISGIFFHFVLQIRTRTPEHRRRVCLGIDDGQNPEVSKIFALLLHIFLDQLRLFVCVFVILRRLYNIGLI